MCGIISVIAKDYHKDMINIFKQLLYVGALRGWDGAGIIQVEHTGTVHTHKKPGPASNLIAHLNKAPETPLWGKILVGHNRAATHGDNTVENTHPFTKDHITLVHNGTLFNHRQLANVVVDSDAICHYLAEHTPQELIDNAYGAYALIWFDSITKTLNILRNEDRPLYLVHTQNMTLLVSEKEMAHWVLARNGIPIIKTEEIKPFTLYSITNEDTKTIKRVKLTTKKKSPIVVSVPQLPRYMGDLERDLKLVKGKEFTGYCYACTPIGAQGNFKCKVILDKDYTEEAIFYSNGNDWTGENVALIYSHITESDNIPVAFGHTPVLVECIEDENFPKEKKYSLVTSANGTVINNAALEYLKDRNCIKCKAPFSAATVDKSHVDLHERNNKIYAYTYLCPKCV